MSENKILPFRQPAKSNALTIDLPFWAKDGDEFEYFAITDDSMIEEGIYQGDIVLFLLGHRRGEGMQGTAQDSPACSTIFD